MTNQQRFSLWAGIGAGVLLAAGFLAVGSPPNPDAATAKVSAFLVDHRGVLMLQACLFGVAGPFVFLFVSGLRATLAQRRPDDEFLATAFFGATLVLLATFSAGSVGLTAVAWRGPAAFSAATVRLAYDSWTLSSYSLTAGASAASVVAVCLLLRRGNLARPWVLWLGALVVTANAGELCGLFVRRGWLAAGRGPGTIAIPAWIAFFVATAVAVLRSGAASAARSAEELAATT